VVKRATDDGEGKRRGKIYFQQILRNEKSGSVDVVKK
jgi:hypothetical protein